ncbi:PadR family transcriptional regulator [Sphingobacterium oryzagri]|uniref:PadR family transcriptional regulator n=1 Tax=Sphingobacterium oryzagri TaxID=3025669 RepID=A0ABY7WJ47_9SPHI|nr:PadR family transcriptional regulator [Sphingobacterium sp. KACC 22765]WDF69616.1 PadR family transcriptional regulator [Sphingobacterium sp. KACC 22765]
MEHEFIPKWKSQLKKGSLPFIVLLFLSKEELYGYELIEKMKNLTEIQIAEGTLYPLMNRLKTEDLLSSKWVEQETGLPRKYYFLTEKGKYVLEEMKTQWTELSKILNKLQ